MRESPRRADVEALALAGMTPVGIAAKLGITVRQVHSYLRDLVHEGKLRRLGHGAYARLVPETRDSEVPLPSPSLHSEVRKVTGGRVKVKILEPYPPSMPNERKRRGGVRWAEDEVHGAMLQATIGPRHQTLQVILHPFTLPFGETPLPEQLLMARKVIRERAETALARAQKSLGVRLDWYSIRVLETFEIEKRLPHLDGLKDQGVIPTSPTSQIDWSHAGANWESKEPLEAAVEAYGLPNRVLNLESSILTIKDDIASMKAVVGELASAFHDFAQEFKKAREPQGPAPPADDGRGYG